MTEYFKAHGVWERGQQAFLDFKVFDPNASQYLNKIMRRCFHVVNKQENKKAHNGRVLKIKHDMFTPMFLKLMEVRVLNFICVTKDCLLSEKEDL